MKTVLFALLISFVSLGLQAQNALTVFSETGDPFYLLLNGVRQNEAPETNVKITGLTQEAYSAKIVFEDEAYPEINKKYLATTGMDCAAPCNVTYRLRLTKKGDMKLRPFTFTSIATAKPTPPNTTVVNYNTTPMPPIGTTVQVTETTTTTTTTGTGSTGTGGVNVGVNAGGPGFDMNVTINDPTAAQMQQQQTHQQTTTITTTTTGGGVQTAEPIVEDCRMGPGDFSQALSSIREKTWDESRLEMANQIARGNCLTAAQVRDIMGVMEWEETRLDFAKNAYGNCADQNKYYMVHDAFEWESSIKELNQAIGY